MATIFSIGHGNRTIGDFIELVKKYEIRYLIDVRSRPYSRFNPAFSKEALDKSLGSHEIRYVFMGDALGGFPTSSACYTPDGRVDYSKLKLQASYLAGIERLKTAWQQGISIGLMCSELKPQHCHRSKLIGVSLSEAGIPDLHIDETGEIKDQVWVMNEVKAEILGVVPGQLSLFGDDRELTLTSRKRHNGTPAQGGSPDEL